MPNTTKFQDKYFNDEYDDDYDDDDYDVESGDDNLPEKTQASAEIDDSYYAEITEKQALAYIELFFKSRTFYLGGPIPQYKFQNPEFIEWIRFASVSDCIQLAHVNFVANKWGSDDDCTRVILSLQDQASQLKIPKHASGGLILIYQKLCLNLDFNSSVEIEYEQECCD